MICVVSCFLSLVINLVSIGEADHGGAKLPTFYRLGRKKREKEKLMEGGKEKKEIGRKEREIIK